MIESIVMCSVLPQDIPPLSYTIQIP